MADVKIPTDEPERSWWLAGARAEGQARDDAIRPEARQVVDCARQLGEDERYGDDAAISAWLARVFTCEWKFSRRLSLAWAIAKPTGGAFKRWRTRLRKDLKADAFATGVAVGVMVSHAMLWLVTLV